MIEKLLDEPYWNELEGLLKAMAVRLNRSEYSFWFTNQERPELRYSIISQILHCLIHTDIRPINGKYLVSINEVMNLIHEPPKVMPYFYRTEMELIKENLFIKLHVRGTSDVTQASYDNFVKINQTNNLHDLYLKLMKS